MSRLKKQVHTYQLERVEKLLDQFSIYVERVDKHSFRLAKMSEMEEKIPTLGMDMAFFVVHAHESRLSINEDNAGIGYARMYKALLQATGKERKYFHFVFYCIKHIYFSLITRFSESEVLLRKGSGSLVKSAAKLLYIWHNKDPSDIVVDSESIYILAYTYLDT